MVLYKVDIKVLSNTSIMTLQLLLQIQRRDLANIYPTASTAQILDSKRVKVDVNVPLKKFATIHLRT